MHGHVIYAKIKQIKSFVKSGKSWLLCLFLLVALLEAKEMDSGRELTREDVETIRDNASAIELPAEIARDMIKSRGYPDIDAENVWNEWLLYRNTKN